MLFTSVYIIWVKPADYYVVSGTRCRSTTSFVGIQPKETISSTHLIMFYSCAYIITASFMYRQDYPYNSARVPNGRKTLCIHPCVVVVLPCTSLHPSIHPYIHPSIHIYIHYFLMSSSVASHFLLPFLSTDCLSIE